MAFETHQKESSPRFPGVYVGQVMDVSTFTKSGQIKVSIPSIFGLTTPESWVSAKLCYLYGHLFMPVAGDKVWLAFENGDPRSPVCLGVFYLPGKVPVEANESPLFNGVIKTAGGHLISLGKEGSITIQDTNNPKTSIELSGSDITINAESGTVQINTVIAEKSIKLGGPQALPVARLGDQGIGNLGAPVMITTAMPPGVPRKVAVE